MNYTKHQPTNNTIDNGRTFANLEPKIREIETFAKSCESQKHETPKRTRRHINKDFKHKVNKVVLLNFDGSRKMTARAWLHNFKNLFYS
jgi:hypothetical protein